MTRPRSSTRTPVWPTCLTNLSNPKSESRETINGQSTIKITGTASADAVNGLAPQLKATQPAPTTAWIEENGDHQLAQIQLEQSSGQLGPDDAVELERAGAGHQAPGRRR